MRRWYAGLALVAALALTACSGLSTSSPIQPGLEVGSVQENEVRVEANPVAPGSSPEQVVTGFISAAAASDDQYQVARSYLAALPQTTWRPESSVVVFAADTPLTVVVASPGVVRATARAVARIDGSGRYQEMPAGSMVSVSFRLARTGGEWRITTVPERFGSWLSESDVDRLYDPYRIYFVSAADRALIPDERWFPSGTGQATRLARALLQGVPDYLKGAVRSAVPTGAALAVDAVTIESGTANVDLVASRLSSDPGQRESLGAQFLATVSQAPGVDRVSLQVQGADLQMPNGENVLSSLAALGFTAQSEPLVKPVLRVGQSLVPVDPEDVGDPVRRTPAQPTVPLPKLQAGWAYLAMSFNGKEIAAVGGDRKELSRWQGDRQVQLTAPGTELTRPTYDRRGILWVAGRRDDGTRVWAIDSTEKSPDTTQPVVVAAPWLADRTVVSLRLAPDGQRIALVTTDRQGKDPRVELAGVTRAPSGRPTALATPLRLAPSLQQVRDLVWLDDARLAVLGRKTATQVIRPWFVPISGPLVAGPEVPGGATITTIGSERRLIVTTDRHAVLLRAGIRWQQVGAGTDLLVAAR